MWDKMPECQDRCQRGQKECQHIWRIECQNKKLPDGISELMSERQLVEPLDAGEACRHCCGALQTWPSALIGGISNHFLDHSERKCLKMVSTSSDLYKVEPNNKHPFGVITCKNHVRKNSGWRVIIGYTISNAIIFHCISIAKIWILFPLRGGDGESVHGSVEEFQYGFRNSVTILPDCRLLCGWIVYGHVWLLSCKYISKITLGIPLFFLTPDW